MTKNKNNQTIWNTRIKNSTPSVFQNVGSSIEVDKRLFKEDIIGSIAHVEMLFKQKIISFKVKNKIIYGLNKIFKEISNKKFEFSEMHEDIHMNIEKRLFQIIGDEAGYLHTARSRNDQVITDFKMWIKSATMEVDNNLNKIIKYCIENNIELYFLTTPLHKEYINSVPKSYKRKFVEISTNEKVKIINMENLSLSLV